MLFIEGEYVWCGEMNKTLSKGEEWNNSNIIQWRREGSDKKRVSFFPIYLPPPPPSHTSKLWGLSNVALTQHVPLQV